MKTVQWIISRDCFLTDILLLNKVVIKVVRIYIYIFPIWWHTSITILNGGDVWLVNMFICPQLVLMGTPWATDECAPGIHYRLPTTSVLSFKQNLFRRWGQRKRTMSLSHVAESPSLHSSHQLGDKEPWDLSLSATCLLLFRQVIFNFFILKI